ncbi:response regulator transcription factor [Microbacterium sp. M1A1_1b]|uniref:response regulator transcription factor n=1 Tax=Curtobacterium sp. VKM Ac-2922 TaxID=2929475 RepID=UPI001FB21F18|nr:response regulator transcription factor [Curtobacterium sp. VKM Ac-2922]MCJ1715821.1 response regulator transcription factor [Curtobacterium sp. VKM Ac-2922]
MRVLIVEDEVFLAEAVQTALRLEAIAADVAGDGERALELVSINDYDVVVLDRDLPVLHGDDVCRALVADPTSPRILMLTAAAELSDRVAGLQLGADDYLGKPFELEELIARIRALNRRSRPALPPVLESGDVRLDPFRREAYRAGRYLHLSRKEFAVLELLLRAEGGVVSAEQLLEKGWDESADPFTNAVRITISTLRKKLGDPAVLHTVPGVGYVVDPDRAGV